MDTALTAAMSTFKVFSLLGQTGGQNSSGSFSHTGPQWKNSHFAISASSAWSPCEQISAGFSLDGTWRQSAMLVNWRIFRTRKFSKVLNFLSRSYTQLRTVTLSVNMKTRSKTSPDSLTIKSRASAATLAAFSSSRGIESSWSSWFSRILLCMSEGTTWAFEKTKKTYALSLSLR